MPTTKDDWGKIKHFKPEEFLCKCSKCDRDQGVSFILVQILDRMREDMGFPFKITSGFRCPKHPLNKNRILPSSHCRGFAVDIYCDQPTHRMKMITYALKRGLFRRCGVAFDFLHFDIDDSPDKSQDVLWTY